VSRDAAGGATGDIASLEAANLRFYDALEASDLDAMTGLWAPDDDVYCVHPGTELVVGAARVRRSWAAVFASGQQLQLIVTDVRCRLLGGEGLGSHGGGGEGLGSHGGGGEGLGSHGGGGESRAGVVTCTENVLTGLGDGTLGGARSLATNVFLWDDAGWRLVGHHASPVLRELG
jgi:hypothetical protein